MKAIELYFPVALLIMLHKLVLTLEFADVITEMKALEQYVPVVLSMTSGN